MSEIDTCDGFRNIRPSSENSKTEAQDFWDDLYENPEQKQEDFETALLRDVYGRDEDEFTFDVNTDTAEANKLLKVQTAEFWDKVTVIELETVRNALRSLLQYLDKIRRKIYYTNFTDTIIDSEEGEPIHGGNDLKNYRKKVEFYLKEHSDRISVYKLRNNKKLSEADLKELERILWTELGSKEDYIKEYGDTPIGRLVRRIVGVDRAAVNEAFSEFLTEERLNLNQMRFVKLIVDYIVVNGNIDDNKVLMGEPFKSVGSITALFKDDMGTAKQIMEVVAQIKRNSEEIA